MTFNKAISVLDNKGSYVGRIEAYKGDEENYTSTFWPKSKIELSSEDLRNIYEKLEEIN